MPDNAIVVRRWTSPERHTDIVAMIHAAFAGLAPPSGVLKETSADFAKRQQEGIVLVAQEADRFVGSLFCVRKGDSLYLTRMAVLPALQKRGIGVLLIQAAEAEARAMKLPKLLLRVRKSLPGNRAYFSKHGFAVIGEGADLGRPPYDVMEKTLSG